MENLLFDVWDATDKQRTYEAYYETSQGLVGVTVYQYESDNKAPGTPRCKWAVSANVPRLPQNATKDSRTWVTVFTDQDGDLPIRHIQGGATDDEYRAACAETVLVTLDRATTLLACMAGELVTAA